MEGNNRILGETAAPKGDGSIIRIVAITFCQRHYFLSEAGDYVHPNGYSPASTSLICRNIPTLSSDPIDPSAHVAVRYDEYLGIFYSRLKQQKITKSQSLQQHESYSSMCHMSTRKEPYDPPEVSS